VGFDVATLSPTYRLMVGMPGGSSAIEIAGRLGMDETILDHALDLLNRDDRTRRAHHVERMLADVQDKQRRLEEELARAAELKVETERAARAAAEVTERLQASERDERKGVKRKLTEELLRARSEIQGILDSLKREKTVARVRDAKERLAEVEAAARMQLTRQHDTVSLQSLRAGDRVEIVSLGTVGTLSEAPEDKKRVRVRVGDAEMSVATSLLVGIGQADGRRVPSRPTMRVSGGLSDPEAPTVVDVRGKTADEALDETVAALDRAALAGHPSLRIIHGHGTGRLKACLRDYLKTSPYVASFRAGVAAEGGDGVTMVQLK
jgi:DNA mismatch repair protein MutS2